MRGTFFCLAIALQTVAIRVQHPAYRAWTYRVPQLLQLLGQVSGAFARPAQRRTGIAARYRFNQPLQGLLQTCIGIATPLAAPARFAQARIDRLIGVAIPRSQLRQSLANGVR